LLPVRVSGSVLLNVLCISGFVDGVMFSHDLAYRGKVIRMDVSNSNSFYRYTHTRLTALCPGLPSWAGTRRVKPIWILLKQETVSGSGISWAICKSAPRSRQTTTPAPLSFLTGRMPFLPPNQQRQSTEGKSFYRYLWTYPFLLFRSSFFPLFSFWFSAVD